MPTIDPYVPIVRLRIVSETPVAQSLRALEEGSAYAAVDATGFAALEDAHLTNCSDVEVVINTASSSGSLDALAHINLARITSMSSLRFVLLFVHATHDDALKAWTCIRGILASLKDVAPEKPIALLIENPVPLAVIRGAVTTNAFEGLRRYLFGADKTMSTLIDRCKVRNPVFLTPPRGHPFTVVVQEQQCMLEEDEVRLRALFPALSDYGMLSFP